LFTVRSAPKTLAAVDHVPEDPAAAPEALAEPALPAEPAVPAGRDTGHEHAVAGSDRLHAGPHGHDRADGLVAEDAPVCHLRRVALEYVQVGAADRHRVDPHDRIGVVLDGGVRDVFPVLAAGAVVNQRLHGGPP
jgi:hypothetical protein